MVGNWNHFPMGFVVRKGAGNRPFSTGSNSSAFFASSPCWRASSDEREAMPIHYSRRRSGEVQAEVVSVYPQRWSVRV